MTDSIQEKFEFFHSNDFEAVKSKLGLLSILGNQEMFVIEGLNFWALVESIKDEIEISADRIDWEVERSVIKMLDLKKLTTMSEELKAITLLPSVRSEEDEVGQYVELEPSEEELNEIFDKLKPFSFSNQGLESLADAFDKNPQKFENFKKKVESLSLIFDEIFWQLHIVVAFLGKIPDQTIYDRFTLLKIIGGEAEENDPFSTMFTLRADLHDPDGREAAFYFITNVFFSPNNDKKYEWYNAVLFTVMFHLVFIKFDLLGDAEQVQILKNGFFKAVICGAPVRKALSGVLYDTKTVANLAIEDKKFFDALDTNQEKAYFQSKIFDVKNICSSFVEKNNEILDSGLMRKYVQSLGLLGDAQQFSEAMLECLDIYARLHEVQLISKNSATDLPEEEIAFRQMEELLLFFANRLKWSKMLPILADKPGNYVSAEFFIKKFNGVADLKDEAVVDKFMAFGQFLKENKLLAEDKDILEYHEADGQFHWAAWLT